MNSLGIDVTDKVVVLKADYYEGDENARRFLCIGGFGCEPGTRGKAIHGRFLTDGETCRVQGYEIEKLSDDQSTTITSATELERSL